MANVVTPVESLQPLTLHNKKWRYKGEGNANVVLTVPEDRMVVRIMKDCGKGMTASEIAETLWLRVGYYDAVRRLYFAGDHDYVDVPAPMSMSVEELRDVDRRIRRDRPQDRTHKSLGWTGGLVAVCPDHTVLSWPVTDQGVSVYCAEIKPKQGWLHEADRVVAGEKCTFCANQFLKLSRGDVGEISRYCPLDLFSGRRKRVELAIRALCRWPQNNLKMFRDGVPVDGGRQAFERLTNDEFGRSDRFCAFIAAALLGDFDGEQHERAAVSPGPFSGVVDDDDGRDKAQPCDFDAVPMPEHCVLHKMLTMQKSQSCSFADVCSAYERLPVSAAQFGHVDRLRSAAVDGGQAVLNPVDGYLVASTARDCSLFVTFRRADRDDGAERHRFDGRSYAVCIKVADLDPKPLSTVDKHRKRNANVSIARDRYAERIH